MDFELQEIIRFYITQLTKTDDLVSKENKLLYQDFLSRYSEAVLMKLTSPRIRAGPNCLNRHYQFISEYLSFY